MLVCGSPIPLAASYNGGFHSGKLVIMIAICLILNKHSNAATEAVHEFGDKLGGTVAEE